MITQVIHDYIGHVLNSWNFVHDHTCSLRVRVGRDQPHRGFIICVLDCVFGELVNFFGKI